MIKYHQVDSPSSCVGLNARSKSASANDKAAALESSCRVPCIGKFMRLSASTSLNRDTQDREVCSDTTGSSRGIDADGSGVRSFGVELSCPCAFAPNSRLPMPTRSLFVTAESSVLAPDDCWSPLTSLCNEASLLSRDSAVECVEDEADTCTFPCISAGSGASVEKKVHTSG